MSNLYSAENHARSVEDYATKQVLDELIKFCKEMAEDIEDLSRELDDLKRTR